MLSAKQTKAANGLNLPSSELSLHQIYVELGMKDLYKQAFVRVMERYHEQKNVEEGKMKCEYGEF